MTKEEIMQLEGRKLDEQIAKQIFDLIVDNALWFTFERVDSDFRPLKAYSSDISAAWEVVEKILSKGLSIKLECEGEDYAFWIIDGGKKIYEYGKTAPEAICKAALIATEV
jgi:hypothetical protein